MLEALQYDFMRNALAAAVLASFICGIMGTIVVSKRLVSMAGGVAHAAYGGVGMALFFWIYATTWSFGLCFGLFSFYGLDDTQGAIQG